MNNQKIQQLKSLTRSARSDALRNGHYLTSWRDTMKGDELVSSCKCKKCGRTITVSTDSSSAVWWPPLDSELKCSPVGPS